MFLRRRTNNRFKFIFILLFYLACLFLKMLKEYSNRMNEIKTRTTFQKIQKKNYEKWKEWDSNAFHSRKFFTYRSRGQVTAKFKSTIESVKWFSWPFRNVTYSSPVFYASCKTQWYFSSIFFAYISILGKKCRNFLLAIPLAMSFPSWISFFSFFRRAKSADFRYSGFPPISLSLRNIQIE